MIRTFLLLALLVCTAVPALAQEEPVLDRTADPVWLDSLYHSGIEFGQFLDEAERRRDRWVNNFGDGTLHAELTEQADSITGTWHLLAVAVAGCSDSVSTLPYLAHLVGYSEHVNMRVVDSTAGRAIMEAHRTKDGRPATPTILVLNDRFEPVGVFIERPEALQEWVDTDGADLSSQDFVRGKFEWYDADAGRQTVGAVLDIIAAASE